MSDRSHPASYVPTTQSGAIPPINRKAHPFLFIKIPPEVSVTPVFSLYLFLENVFLLLQGSIEIQQRNMTFNLSIEKAYMISLSL